jgi:hypothetical protein
MEARAEPLDARLPSAAPIEHSEAMFVCPGCRGSGMLLAKLQRHLACRRAAVVLILTALALTLPACRMNASEEGAAASAGRVRIGGILWYVDYGDAVRIAREQDKALWVHFGETPG